MPVPAHTFTEAELIDIRRYCGYPAVGTGVVVFPFPWWFKYYSALETRLQNLTDTEATVVTTYLTQLDALELAIFNASTNLGTSAAAVWTRNEKEIHDRTNLLDQWRRKLCGFLGVPAGPDLGDSGNSIRIVV